MKHFHAGSISVILHVLVIAGLLLFAANHGSLFKRQREARPELTVAFGNIELAQEEARPQEPPRVEPPSQPDEIPIQQKQDPPKTPRPQTIRQNNRVVRKMPVKPTDMPTEKPPTPQEIANAINNSVSGVKSGNTRPLTADERSRNESLIASVLYKAWDPPSREASAFPPPTVGFRVRPGGLIVDPRILKSSGNAAFDKSALDAVGRVGTIPGLSEKFIAECQKEEIVVEFKLRDMMNAL